MEYKDYIQSIVDRKIIVRKALKKTPDFSFASLNSHDQRKLLKLKLESMNTDNFNEIEKETLQKSFWVYLKLQIIEDIEDLYCDQLNPEECEPLAADSEQVRLDDENESARADNIDSPSFEKQWQADMNHLHGN